MRSPRWRAGGSTSHPTIAGITGDHHSRIEPSRYPTQPRPVTSKKAQPFATCRPHLQRPNAYCNTPQSNEKPTLAIHLELLAPLIAMGRPSGDNQDSTAAGSELVYPGQHHYNLISRVSSATQKTMGDIWQYSTANASELLSYVTRKDRGHELESLHPTAFHVSHCANGHKIASFYESAEAVAKCNRKARLPRSCIDDLTDTFIRSPERVADLYSTCLGISLPIEK